MNTKKSILPLINTCNFKPIKILLQMQVKSVRSHRVALVNIITFIIDVKTGTTDIIQDTCIIKAKYC